VIVLAHIVYFISAKIVLQLLKTDSGLGIALVCSTLCHASGVALQQLALEKSLDKGAVWDFYMTLHCGQEITAFGKFPMDQ